MSKEKKETKATVNPDLEGENKALKGIIEALRKSGTEMGEEIKSLKFKIRSYSAANTRMKNDLEKSNKKAALVDGLSSDNTDLRIMVEKRNQAIARMEQDNISLSGKASFFENKINWYNKLPWYRKIFVNTIA